ncbi:MAG TPA: DNA recombination protein RmuC [Bacteroidales bacterium]|jgi:DNA recombination protein RmuC|nr:DNA recombination protein RmuC [Bacteroidales bacterium]HKM12218.1 DNA recombination protein RmuC [Bacteroidales bacterium]HPB88902.1 DNA recombination protein RmuC [Bacteroidales bacterium]HPY22242.1 DNA recombination protein RmuC [Bacteroidales bacterium]HQA93403.1 DNA recombination protein RmuC [Bacteroidales bacterium]
MNTIAIIMAVGAALLTGIIVWLVTRRRFSAKINEKELTIVVLKKDLEHTNGRIADMEQTHAKFLEQLDKSHKESLFHQLETLKAQMVAQNEEILKGREAEFDRHAKASFDSITEQLNKELKRMTDSFDAEKRNRTETSSTLRTQLEEAVKNIKDQSFNIGDKADRLATAIRGNNKIQGCWGETQLANLLNAEGLIEGRDYHREQTLRDELGLVQLHDETGRKMRPDFILHYPDKTDVVVDCKVSLVALSDYMEATDEKAREEASERNLKAILNHVKELSSKDYSSYIPKDRKTLDYVLMYVPNVNAMILARQKSPQIINEAFAKNVLITTEETFMPFLRLVRSAWINVEQARNHANIVDAARRMLERVADFVKHHEELGKALKNAQEKYESTDKKIREGGQSIVKAANDVIRYGVTPGKNKALPSDD